MRIGDHTFPLGAVLAPMAGFTDASFRLLCRWLGAELTVTEMISAAALCFHDKKTARLARLPLDDSPAAVQLFGHDPEQMRRAAGMIASGEYEGACSAVPPAMIDLNMGCPVKKIVSSGDGSALMKDPLLASRIVKSVREVTDRYGVPLTVKIRAGWDKNSINAPSFAALMADSGASLITVHGRTREQMYAPSSDNGLIRRVREAVSEAVPVIGNGDITTADDALRMINETGCNGVAVGRAALGNVWLFSEIKAVSDGKSFTTPTVEDRIAVALQLVSEVVKENGELAGIRESRGRAAHFIRGLRGSSAVRDKLNHAETLSEFKDILNGLI